MKYSYCIAFFLFVLSILYTSCDKDPCEDVDCGPFGTCIEMACVCDDGYELGGAQECIESRMKYYGTYDGSATCDGLLQSWSMIVKVSETGGVDHILFSNIGNYGQDVEGVLDGNDVVFTTSSGSTINLAGTGTFIGDTLNFSYTVEDSISGFTESCAGTAIKI